MPTTNEILAQDIIDGLRNRIKELEERIEYEESFKGYVTAAETPKHTHDEPCDEYEDIV